MQLCDVYILIKGTIAIAGSGADEAIIQADKKDKDVILKNCIPFTVSIKEIDNTKVDNVKNMDVVMPMSNLVEPGDSYSKNFLSLWQYYRDEANDTIANSESFKFKARTTDQFPADVNTKNVEIAVQLKYLCNFWITLEMTLINCEVTIILTWMENWVISVATGATIFAIKDVKLYVPVVTLSIQDNA